MSANRSQEANKSLSEKRVAPQITFFKEKKDEGLNPSASKLLALIERSELDKIEKIINGDPAIMFNFGSFTDSSGRKFSSISPLQFAAWQMNSQVLKLMLANFSEFDENPNLNCLRNKQIKILINKGIEFQYDNKIHCSRYIDLNTILDEMNEYINQYNSWSESDRKLHSQLIKKLQQKLPRHVVSKFLAKPDKSETLLDTSFMVYNSQTRQLEDWYKKTDATNPSFMIINGFKARFPTTMEMPKANPDSLGLNVSDNLDTLSDTINEIYNEITAILENHFSELNLSINYTRVRKMNPLIRNCAH